MPPFIAPPDPALAIILAHARILQRLSERVVARAEVYESDNDRDCAIVSTALYAVARTLADEALALLQEVAQTNTNNET